MIWGGVPYDWIALAQRNIVELETELIRAWQPKTNKNKLE